MSTVSLLRDYTTKLSLTNDNIYPGLIDQVHREVPYLWWMANKSRPGGGIVFERGGTKLKFDIVHAQNTNTKAYYGAESLTSSETDEVTAGFEGWKSYGQMIQVHLDEILENYGTEGMMKIVPSKYQIALMSMYQSVHQDLLKGIVGVGADPLPRRFTATTAKSLLPLGFLIQKEFTNVDRIHELDQTVQTFFQNQVKLGAVSNYAEFRQEMRNLSHSCSFGSTNDAPDLGLCTQDYYELIESAYDDRRRYVDTDTADGGWENVRIGPTTFLIDYQVPGFGNTVADTVTLNPTAARSGCFWINSNWMQLVVHELAYFQPTPWVEAATATALFSKIVLKAIHRCVQRRKQGLHFNVDATVVS